MVWRFSSIRPTSLSSSSFICLSCSESDLIPHFQFNSQSRLFVNMECRTLEITLIFAKDLEDVNVDSKMDLDAAVIINGEPQTKQKIPVDKDWGSNPKWNYTMTFTAEEAAANRKRLELVICLVSDRLFGDVVIWDVLVSINGFPDCEEKVSIYGVRLPKGKVKGTLNLCCKIEEKFSVPVAPPTHETEKAKPAETPVMRYLPVGYSAGYPPQLPATYAYNSNQQGAYPQPLPHWYGGHPPSQGAYPPPPPHWYGGFPPPQDANPPPPPHWYGMYPPPQDENPPPSPHWYGGYPPKQDAYPPPPPPQVAYPPPPPHWYGGYPPPPAQGYGYTGHLPNGGHGYMPAQQPAAVLGQVPAGGLLGSLFMVNMGCDAFASLTDALGGLLNL